MRNASLSSVLCLLSSLALAAPSVTNTFVYSAGFGAFDEQGDVETVGVTTNVTMTVALYGSKSAANPLWCRRLEVPVWNGLFAVELDDARGTSDPELNPKYGLLSDLVAHANPDDEWWVGVSRPRVGDAKPSGITQDSPAHGKVSSVPFALQAERAVGARGGFTVSGKATVRNLAMPAGSRLDVAGGVTFCGSVDFEKPVTFGQEGVVVEGQLKRSSLDGIEIVSARNVSVLEKITTARMTVTNGLATTITPAAGGVPSLANVSVAGTLTAQGGVNVGCVAADCVTVGGKLTLYSGALIDWRPVGGMEPCLSAPEGVYPTNLNTVALKKATSDAYTYSNETKKELLSSVVLSCRNGTNTVTLAADSGNQPWCRAGSGGTNASITVTALCPLSKGTRKSCSVSGSGHVVSRTDKELEK